MRLSVEVKRQQGMYIFSCRGSLLQGEASDYLFHLLTRSNHQDVILDLAALTSFDQAGVHAVVLGNTFLAACHRRLFLRDAPSSLLKKIRCLHHPPLAQLYSLQEAGLADAANG